MVDIEKLEAVHGEVKVYNTPLGEVAVRAPSRVEFQAYQKAINEDSKSFSALDNLAIQCVVHPTREEFKSMLEKKPGIGMPIGRGVEKMSGISEVEEAKKD